MVTRKVIVWPCLKKKKCSEQNVMCSKRCHVLWKRHYDQRMVVRACLETLTGACNQYLCSLDWLSLPSNWRRNSSLCRVHRLCRKGMELTRQISQSNLGIQQECCSQITGIHRNLTCSEVMYRQLFVTNPAGLWKKQFRTHSYIGHLGEEDTLWNFSVFISSLWVPPLCKGREVSTK